VSYGTAGFEAALGGVAGAPNTRWVALHQMANNPGSSGAGHDAAVGTEPIAFAAPSGGSVTTSAQVPFQIPVGGAGTTRTYRYFSVWDGPDPATAAYITGDQLDADEVFSENGGTLNLSVTLTAEDAPA
jgi:hypothetical protein